MNPKAEFDTPTKTANAEKKLNRKDCPVAFPIEIRPKSLFLFFTSFMVSASFSEEDSQSSFGTTSICLSSSFIEIYPRMNPTLSDTISFKRSMRFKRL
jgi:hypothetical protein